MCPETASPWMAGCVEGSGQVPRMVIISHSQEMYHLIERCLVYPKEN